MQDYRNFGPEQLAIDVSFRRWQLLNEPADRVFWEDWLMQNPDKKDLVEKAAYLLIALSNHYTQPSNQEQAISEREIAAEIHRLHQSLDVPDNPSVKRFTYPWLRYSIAAGLLLMLGFFGWYAFQSLVEHRSRTITYQRLTTQAATPLLEVANTTDKPKLVNLPDASSILLYPHSRISYARKFPGSKREVYLAGKAFFEVAKDPSRPFYVYADGLVTKVLGTSFTVQTFDNHEQVKVVVKTGRVTVFARHPASRQQQQEDNSEGALVLTPNQQVLFSAPDTRLTKSVVEHPSVVEWPIEQLRFNFKRTPIAAVFAQLEKAYGIRILYDQEVMQNCYLTATLTDEPLFEKLDLICNTIDARYEQIDGQVIIYSKGCNL
ncbi:FecR family protein [Nibrella viscosa]|uniref:FecR family protein n=1 Tax=Nibrella viscosa TaxID=1084524 RepID=A0ABP8KR04_9BACT